MSRLAAIRDELFAISLELGAIKLDMNFPFRWSSGYMMPIYNDSRLLLSLPGARRLIAEGLELLLRGQTCADVANIAGVATGGIAHAVLLAERLQLPVQYVRSSAKAHGSLRQVECLPHGQYGGQYGGQHGGQNDGQSVALIEDVISTGESLLRAVEAVRQIGANVTACFAIYSYDFLKVQQAFAAAALPYGSLLSFAQLLNYVGQRQLFRAEQLAQLREWHADPFVLRAPQAR